MSTAFGCEVVSPKTPSDPTAPLRPGSSRRLDDVFRAFVHIENRRLLWDLMTAEDGIDVPVFDQSSLGPKDVDLVDLYHNRLPALEAMSFVTWDRKAGFLTPGPRFDDVRWLVDRLDRAEDVSL